MGTKTKSLDSVTSKVTHAVTARGAKIIRRTKDDTWYLKRGNSKMALTLQEAACVAVDGYIVRGAQGGEQFERLVSQMWSRTTYKPKKDKKTSLSKSV